MTYTETPQKLMMRRILIIRLSAMGDIVMASPVAQALRHAYPEAHIGWMVQKEFAPLLQENPYIDEIVTWDKQQWRQWWQTRRFKTLYEAFKTLRAQLREMEFDTVIDLQGLLKSATWAWFSGAANRIGLGNKEGSHLLMTKVLERSPSDPRIGSEYLDLIVQLGLSMENVVMNIHDNKDDRRQIEEKLQQAGLESFAVFCPFTTRSQKHWFDERWQYLANMIEDKYALPCLVLGGPGDKEHAETLCTHPNMINWCGETGLRQAYTVLRKADFVVGVDTGLTHMALAAMRPTVALFGATIPYINPMHYPGKIIYHPMPCSPCRRQPSCEGAFHCMRAIDMDQVMHGLEKIYSP